MKGLFAPPAGTFTFRARWIRRRGWILGWDLVFTPPLNVAPGVTATCDPSLPPPAGPAAFDAVVTFTRIPT